MKLEFLLPKGTTSVTHDSEDPTDVGHCEEPGCYSRKVNYAATMNQIKALKAISAECHQFNKVTRLNMLYILNITYLFCA